MFSAPVDSSDVEDGALQQTGDEQPDSAAAEITPVKLSVGGEEPLTIVNFRKELPEATSARTRGVFVRAAEGAGLLDEDGRHAVARALVSPETAGQLIKGGLLVTETVETATLSQVTGHVWTSELWPLLQPRTEAESLTVKRPHISGVLDENKEPLAELVLTFEDRQHLANYMYQTITHTRRTGNDYAPSILARRVGRPVLAHVVRLEFEDGSQPFTVLAVRDGLTRLVSAAAARIGSKATPDDVAQHMISELMAEAPPRAGKASDASQDHARGRDRIASELRARFAAGVVGDMPTEDSVRIGQTFTMPAQIYVDVQATATVMLPADEVFSEAIRAVVGSIHTEFRSWDPAAQAVDVGERALMRAQHAGKLDPDVVKLAMGRLGPEQVSRIFGDARIPDTALWRAVYLVHALTQPEAFAGIKEQLRSLLGLTNIQGKRFVSYLGPLVDVPWRTAKARSLQQARKAWSGGGPIPHRLLGAEWEPIPTDHFLSLVPKAMNGDINARRTLQVAGGIALVADRLLASNIGSALQSGVVPFRANPNDIVDSLGAHGNEVGLYQLAYAAQTFDAGRPAVNAFSERDFKDVQDVIDAYTVPAVDPGNPSQIREDGTGQPVKLTQYEVVRLSDPERAAKAAAEAGQADSGFTMPQSEEANAQKLRESLISTLGSAQEILRRLLQPAESVGAMGPALGNRDDWAELQRRAQKISAIITMNEPHPEDDLVAENADDEDEYAGGEEDF
ncbi:hypothetical protein ACIBO1_02870 [Micromonospora sp. NPDC049903]|uniref:hypothetical protein n=1 Tax=Micromonospora sp. NPDC049903 TaxID=3364276 RepID=UPI0037B2B9EB